MRILPILCKHYVSNDNFLPGRTQGRDFGGRNPSLLEVKAMLLMADIVRELSNDNIHFGSNQ